jgi:hypothetical protein
MRHAENWVWCQMGKGRFITLYLDLDTVASEQGLGRRILSGTPHRRLGVVEND